MENNQPQGIDKSEENQASFRSLRSCSDDSNIIDIKDVEKKRDSIIKESETKDSEIREFPSQISNVYSAYEQVFY